jgi:hypothetical protein
MFFRLQPRFRRTCRHLDGATRNHSSLSPQDHQRSCLLRPAKLNYKAPWPGQVREGNVLVLQGKLFEVIKYNYTQGHGRQLGVVQVGTHR